MNSNLHFEIETFRCFGVPNTNDHGAHVASYFFPVMERKNNKCGETRAQGLDKVGYFHNNFGDHTES